MEEQQKRVVKVLENLIELVKDDFDFSEAFSDDLECLLDEIHSNDGFGTEGQVDPRGDFRDCEWNMWMVEGVDS
jgi:hypothetical protein